MSTYFFQKDLHKQIESKENIIVKAFYFQFISQICYNAKYIPLKDREKLGLCLCNSRASIGF